MKRNNISPIAAVPLVLGADCPPVGGQAVMDGVMMRNGGMYAIAVRQESGQILAQRLPWRVLCRSAYLRAPFVRGFPILLETLVNGIQALNRSVALSSGEKEMANAGFWPMVVSLGMAFLMAVALFIVAPHLLSLLMLALNMGGDVEKLSFHIWDGFYKCAIFIAYIWLISLVPEIRRVFQYHGAEHKTINAWENSVDVDSAAAFSMSRLHPRCGTTFLLFVICISIILQAVLVPLFLKIWPQTGLFAKHAESIFLKLMLIIPISAVAYELIRFAARLPQGLFATILQAPGLALQRLTTREPSPAQLEVAVVALAEALGSDENDGIHTVPYHKISSISE